MRVLKTIGHPDGKRRVLIVRRDNGMFGFEEEAFSEEPFENCWLPCGEDTFALCESEETAEREARGRIPWLAALRR